jgi:hypothetical protein
MKKFKTTVWDYAVLAVLIALVWGKSVREKHMMRETEVQIGNPGSNRPSIFDNDGSSHEGVLL